MYKTTWVEVDLGILRQNIRKAKARMKETTLLCGAVKANAYGHGALEVAKVFVSEGAEFLGVANLQEAQELRAGGIQAKILVLGWTPPESFKQAVLENISLCCFSSEDLALLNQVAQSLGKKVSVHLKIETGMNRLGVSWDGEILTLAQEVLKYPYIKIEGVFSHFANADLKDTQRVNLQFARYQEGIALLKDAGISPGICHIANSAAIFYYPETQLDMVRLGAAAYGVGMDRETDVGLPMTLKTRISHIKYLAPHEPVGYGGTFQSDEMIRVATLPIGYADGWTWALRNFVIHYQGKRLRTVGNICMDQMMLDISEWKEAKVGDEIILMGPGGATPLEISKYVGVTEGELPTRIGPRVPRVYIE